MNCRKFNFVIPLFGGMSVVASATDGVVREVVEAGGWVIVAVVFSSIF